MVAINPALLRLSTPAGIHYDLHLPQGTKAQFEERIAAIPVEKRASWRFHEMRTGESLEQVAQLFHVSGHDVRVANDLSDDDPVGAGDELVVPVYSVGQPSTRPLQYTAHGGDTLVTVADRFNVSVGELREWNHLDTGEIGSGDTVYVSEPVRLPPAGRGHVRASRRGRAMVARGRRGSSNGYSGRGVRGRAGVRTASARGGSVRGGSARSGTARSGSARSGGVRAHGAGLARTGAASKAHASGRRTRR